MKRYIMAAVLVSMAAGAEEEAKVEEPAKAEVCPLHKYQSLSDLWNKTEMGNGIKQALVNGTPSLEFLASYEFSDLKSNATDPANALITRTRLNYLT